MDTLDAIRCLHEVFGNRQLRQIPDEPRVLRPGQPTASGVLVLDLALSRAILRSPAFASINEFSDGFARLAGRGRAVPTLDACFRQLPLYREGPPARETRRTLLALLRRQEDVLTDQEPVITRLMLARRQRLRSPLAFSRLLVELCLATLMRGLLPISLRQCLRALRERRNVFYFHFHGLRHQATERALRHLAPHHDPAIVASPELLACQSMVVMGFDPLVATVCASLVDTGKGPDAAAPSRYCPVSFVTRVCTENVTIGSFQAHTGDRCYVSLVPTQAETATQRIPFGAGAHTCIGRSLSLAILAMAGRIVDQGFRSGFDDACVLAPDGAFLSFDDGGQPVEPGT